MRPFGTLLVLTAGLAAGLGTVGAVLVAPLPAAVAAPSDGDPAVTEAIAAVDALVKANDEMKLNAKLVEVEANAAVFRSPEWEKKLLETMKKTAIDGIFKTCAAQLGRLKSKSALSWFKSKLDDKDMLKEKKGRYLAVLEALASYGDELGKVQNDLEDIVKSKKSTPNMGDVSSRAVRAYGSVKSGKTMETLLDWLKETENTKGGGGQGGGSSKSMTAEAKEALNQTGSAVLDTLKLLTGKDLDQHEKWVEWWEKQKKPFTAWHDLNAPEPDITGKKEFPDESWGYTLKLPDLPNWTLSKCPPEDTRGGMTGRVMAVNQDGNMKWARVKALTYKKTAALSTPEAFCKYFEDVWTKTDFGEFAQKPAITTKKIGGKDFTVITCKGIANTATDSKSSWKAWGGVELRFYVHLPEGGGTFLYFETVCKTSAEQPMKDATFGMVENLKFRD